MRRSRFPVLVADIGGTFSRFAILAAPDETLALLGTVSTNDFPDPETAITAVLASHPGRRPHSALLGIAGRVENQPIRLTNANWSLDPRKIADAAKLDLVTIVNDYLPVAAVLRHLSMSDPGQVVAIGPALTGDDGPRLAFGPGTGLGAAVLRRVVTHDLLEPTEAGHTEFGACEPDELALWPYLERVGGRITAESVLSGPGLVRLCRALCQLRSTPSVLATPADVTEAAARGDPLAQEAIGLFARLLGRFAGDLALTFGATGGVFLSGGIAPRILAELRSGGFRSSFERKHPFADVVSRIPTYLITASQPALLGLSRIASHPENFAYSHRQWPD